MSRRLIVSSDATRDLADIWFRRAKSSLSSADQLLDRLQEKFDLLATHAELGQRAQFLRRDGRVFSAEGCAILYLATADELTIVRVVHGGQAMAFMFLPHEE